MVMPVSESRSPVRHSLRLSRTGRWIAAGALGASLAFGSPKARAQEISAHDSAVAAHVLRGTVEEVRRIVPPRVQRELAKAKTKEEWFKILNAGLRKHEKGALLAVLRDEFERHPEIQRLVLKRLDSEHRVQKRTADAVLAAVLSFAAVGWLGYRVGKQRKPRSTEPIRVQLVRSSPRKE
jgi:hypothetical protein